MWQKTFHRAWGHCGAVPFTDSLCCVSDASGCLYKRSEKKLGSQEMGAVVMMQAFQGEESHIRLEGVQFQHVGQAFQQHLSALTIAGTARLTGEIIMLLHSRERPR